MAELANCANCGAVFVKHQFRNICDKCWKEEEAAFDKVRDFIRKRENRTASMKEISEGTGVSEVLILKFIKKGRLNIARMPNVRYPCEGCGKKIQSGRLCQTCAGKLHQDLEMLREEERKKDRKDTYYAIHKRYKSSE